RPRGLHEAPARDRVLTRSAALFGYSAGDERMDLPAASGGRHAWTRPAAFAGDGAAPPDPRSRAPVGESGRGRPVGGASGEDRPGTDRPDRAQELSGRRRARRAEGSCRVLRSRWAARPEDRRADDEGRDLPALLDDEALHVGGGDDARRGGATAP